MAGNFPHLSCEELPMSNRWKANILTAVIVVVLAFACAHSYGFL
jgi:hypothetical protein